MADWLRLNWGSVPRAFKRVSAIYADDDGNLKVRNPDGSSSDLGGGGNGGSIPDPITTDVNIEPDAAGTVGLSSPFIIQDITEPGPAYVANNLNSDGAGNVDSALAVAALGTGTACVSGTDTNGKDGYFQWFTAYGWSHQPRSDAADADQTFVLYDKNADELIEGRAGGTLGFFNTTPTAQPVVPLTTPDVQDVIDALVALGLVAQHD